MKPKRPYHHGDLRQALMAGAVDAIIENGPSAVSLRDIARRTGVSHAAPTHHFPDKASLFTAIAVEGFDLLADDLELASRDHGDLLEVGVAYVRFAVGHRAHFEVMYRPDLFHHDDPEVLKASARSDAALAASVAGLPSGTTRADPNVVGLAAWSLVHGFATLWNSRALPEGLGSDPEAAARAVAGVLFDRRSRSRGTR